jgi:hypothetical protein
VQQGRLRLVFWEETPVFLKRRGGRAVYAVQVMRLGRTWMKGWDPRLGSKALI